MSELIEEIKLHRVSYLVEILQKGDMNHKINAMKKLEKMRITKNIGLFLIDAAKYDYGVNDYNGGINSSLISLCFNNYYDEYTKAIAKTYSRLSEEAKAKVVFLLSSIDNESALKLYIDLVLEDYKDSDFIPVSNLFERPYLYTYLFPKLYKALKFKNYKNNILIVLNDYLNAGVVNEVDLKKNKKIIIDCISKIFEETLKYKGKNTREFLANEEYSSLRFFLEIAINIELYVSNKETEKILKKIYNKNDNQICLFILDNYMRKGKSIKSFNIEKIAKDEGSRFPLYEMLYRNNMIDLFPKKYLKNEILAKSEFYINFMNFTRYQNELKSLKFIKKYVYEDYEYYAFKYKYSFEFQRPESDYATDYVMHLSGVDNFNKKMVTKDYIALSGGYLKDSEYFYPTFNHGRLLLMDYNKNENIDDVVDKLKIREEIISKTIKPEEIIEETEIKRHSFTFSYILIFMFLIFVLMLSTAVLFAYKPSFIQTNKYEVNNYVTSKLNKDIEFKEIDAHNIFNVEDEEYYVLFYKKTSDKYRYYTFINNFIKNGIKIYYVDMSKEENRFLNNPNDLSFIVDKDRLLKVKDREYEYYVDGKINILREMKEINKKIIDDKTKKDL